jgi:hypothetical protein
MLPRGWRDGTQLEQSRCAAVSSLARRTILSLREIAGRRWVKTRGCGRSARPGLVLERRGGRP